MDFVRYNLKFLSLEAILFFYLFFSGCGPQVPKKIVTCPPAESAVQAIDALKSKPENMVSIKVNGQCRLSYYVDDKSKPQTENFNVKIWFNPPNEIYLQGDIAFNAKGLVLGSNEEEFWFSVKPEVDSYWWGRWSELDNSAKLMINPEILLEAFGVVKTDAGAALSSEDGFDVIVRKNTVGSISRKIYIDRCSHQVVRIVHFNEKGKKVVNAGFDEYKKIGDNYSVPFRVEIETNFNGEKKDFVRLKLQSVTPMEFSKKQKVLLFNRPEPKGFKHIYKLGENF